VGWGKGGALAVGRNYGFLIFPGGHRGCIWNLFARAEFKWLFSVAISRFEFEHDGREVVVRGGLTAEPKEYTQRG